MSKTRKIIFSVVGWWLLLYAAFVFVLQEGAPIDWILGNRFLYAMLAIIGGLGIMAAILDQKE